MADIKSPKILSFILKYLINKTVPKERSAKDVTVFNIGNICPEYNATFNINLPNRASNIPVVKLKT